MTISVSRVKLPLRNVPFNAKRQAKKLRLPRFGCLFSDSTRKKIKPEWIILRADALSTKPLIGKKIEVQKRFMNKNANRFFPFFFCEEGFFS